MSNTWSSEAIRFPEQASLHEKATQAVARGDVVPFKKVRRDNGRTKRVTTTRDEKVHPELLKAARAMCGPDQHYKITDTNQIIILNGKKGNRG
jgi:hypothetical protein